MSQRTSENGKHRRPHGEGGLFEIKNGQGKGSWVARLDLGWQDGKRKRKEGRFRTQAEARAALNTWRRDHEDGLPIPEERLTVGSFLDHWLLDCAKPTVRPKTYSSYAQLVRLHLKPSLGQIRLAKLRPQDVQAFMNAKLQAGLSPRTVQYLRAVLRRALGQALKWGLVKRNVATLVDPPKSQHQEVQPLTAEQARVFLEAVRGDRLEALYKVALALGLRQGETLGLHWAEIDLDAGTLTVRQQLQRIEGGLQLVDLKTEKSRRTLHLPAFAVDALRRHKVRQLEERLAAGPAWQETTFVFTSTIGTPLEPRNLVRQFHAHLRRADLPHKRFHDLRHSAASLLRAQGVPLADIKDILGHSQISITSDLYAHILGEAKRQAAVTMDALLGERAVE